MIVIHRHLQDKHSSISSIIFTLVNINQIDISVKNKNVYQYQFDGRHEKQNKRVFFKLMIPIYVNWPIRIIAFVLQTHIQDEFAHIDSYICITFS